VRVQKGG